MIQFIDNNFITDHDHQYTPSFLPFQFSAMLPSPSLMPASVNISAIQFPIGLPGCTCSCTCGNSLVELQLRQQYQTSMIADATTPNDQVEIIQVNAVNSSISTPTKKRKRNKSKNNAVTPLLSQTIPANTITHLETLDDLINCNTPHHVTSIKLCDIPTLPKYIGHLSQFINATRVIINSCRINDTRFTTNMHHLEYLDASCNYIKEVQSFASNPKLSHLDLRCNCITTLPSLKPNLALAHINVSVNDLTNMPQLNHLNNLNYLNVFDNDLAVLPCMDQLKQLTKLYIGKNIRIKSLQPIYSLIDTLEFLNYQGITALDYSNQQLKMFLSCIIKKRQVH